MALAASGPQLALDLRRLLARSLEFGRHAAFSESAPIERLAAISIEALVLFAPVFGALTLAAVAGSVAVGGWVFSAKAFSLDPGRMSPARGLSNLFSINSLSELCKALAKAALVTAVGWLVFELSRAELIAAARAPVELAAAGMSGTMIAGFLMLAASLAVIAAFDVPFVLWRHARDLRMTREEMRHESRESEGDPQIRMRVRSVQREMARKRMMAEVPKADVVVTNPTHYAVALSYRDGMRAPRVVAKGSERIAIRIRELAAENQVPLLEAPMLARALYRHAPLGAAIPAGLYDAVAQVLAWVFQLRRSRQTGEAAPRAPERVDVPQELAVLEDSA
jgi:flagellar biosynthetic protein FlhB